MIKNGGERKTSGFQKVQKDRLESLWGYPLWQKQRYMESEAHQWLDMEKLTKRTESYRINRTTQVRNS